MDTSRAAAREIALRVSQTGTAKRQQRTWRRSGGSSKRRWCEGASVARVARAHGVNANQVFGWRKLYLAGRLGGSGAVKLLPVHVNESSPSLATPARSEGSCSTSLAGTIHIELRARAGAHRGQRRSGFVAGVVGVPAGMIGPPTNTRVWIAAGVTDLRRGFTGLSALVQTKLEQSPFSGQVFVFRGRRGDLIKVLWYDGDGLCLFAKRLERGRFVWPQAASGTVSLTRAQLSMLLEGIDWRRPERTWDPQLSV